MLQRRFTWSAVEVRAWMCNYIPSLYMCVIIYPSFNPDAGLANLSLQKGPVKAKFTGDIYVSMARVVLMKWNH